MTKRIFAKAPKGKEYLYNPKTAIYTNGLPKKHEDYIIKALNEILCKEDETYHAYDIDKYNSAYVYCDKKLLWRNSVKIVNGFSFN